MSRQPRALHPGWRWFGSLAVAIRQSYRYRLRFWWKLGFFLEASGSLGSFRCGRELSLDAPVRVGSGKGSLQIADRVWLGWEAAPRLGSGTILLEPRSPESVIAIGEATAMSNNVSIIAMGSVRIGQHCVIGDMTQIFDCDFHEFEPARRNAGAGSIEPVCLGDNVWIGSRVMILRGVTIGDNSIIGAGSVVTRSIPPDSIAAGVPAKVIRLL